MPSDVSGHDLSVGDIVQSVLDPDVGTWRDRNLGEIVELDASPDHVWVAGRVWWDVTGLVADWASSTPVRTHTNLLFHVADSGADPRELARADHPDSPSAERLAELNRHDSSAARMWGSRARP